MKAIITALLGATIWLCMPGPLAARTAMQIDCQAPPIAHSKITLAWLADLYFADISYRYAIMLATNSRTADGFPFIGNPDELPLGKTLCVPAHGEAERLRQRYINYSDAIHAMTQADPADQSTLLDPVDPSRTVIAVSWVRADQADGYRKKIGTTMEVSGDTWVTVALHLQRFCAEWTGPGTATISRG
ncbi:hypothetical protein [Breoghania sp.]|uniref:hypothetical protein n=1 Tax=Breoghania sp. TaxID=2065378 RepID=UPI00261471A4|nr:hypothetical protein [Breoghania sp.]MDJ0931961.1 hypothetical protein [Breoghania sp.]